MRRIRLLFLAVLALVAASNPLASQDVRPGTDAEQRVVELNVLPELLKYQEFRVPLWIEPRLYVEDRVPFLRPWELAWANFAEDSAGWRVSASHDSTHMAAVAAAVRGQALLVPDSCMQGATCIGVDSLRRLAFSPSLMKGDSAFIRVHILRMIHACEDSARMSVRDLMRYDSHIRVLLVRRNSQWSVAASTPVITGSTSRAILSAICAGTRVGDSDPSHKWLSLLLVGNYRKAGTSKRS
jgi:hypothetical protein